MKMRGLFVLILSASVVGFLGLGCARDWHGGKLDARSGSVSKAHQVDISTVTPISIRLDSRFKNYYMAEHLVFLGDLDTLRYAVTLTFARGLNDNRFRRAERDFSGFILDGKYGYWQPLPYVRAKHDSARLEVNYGYHFGGLNWGEPGKSGTVKYNLRGIRFELRFGDLRPVQHFRDGDSRLRAHATGDATLILPADSITGSIYYELLQLEGYDPFDSVNIGIEYVNYDWMALTSSEGARLIVSSDTATSKERIRKNFLALLRKEGLTYAEGSQYVRVVSDDIKRDFKIYDWLALRKKLSVAEAGVDVNVTLTDKRIFYTNGLALALVEGELSLDGRSKKIWGVLEHRQQPKTGSELLR